MFRFVHTADIHLDSPMKSLALHDPEAAEVVANATRSSFSQIVELCLEEKVDALLIAGDLYDGELRSMKTAAFVVGAFHRLGEAGIPVYLIRGNHDAASQITRHLSFPPNVHVFTGHAAAVQVPGHDVTIHGMSFASPAAPESLLPRYKPAEAGRVNIGLLHTSLAGAPEHDPYAPCSVAELSDQGYDYWALGHIHKRQVHASHPCAIVMPGIPQGRHINESGPKSVSLVTIGTDRRIDIAERSVGAVQFERVIVDLGGAENWSEMLMRTEAALASQMERVSMPAMVARIRFTGASALAGKLRRDADLLGEEIREVARRLGDIFIEKLTVDVRPPMLEVKSAGADPLIELRGLMASGRERGSSARSKLEELLDEVRRKLPPELRDAFGSDEADSSDLVARLLEEGAEEVLARLEAGRETE